MNLNIQQKIKIARVTEIKVPVSYNIFKQVTHCESNFRCQKSKLNKLVKHNIESSNHLNYKETEIIFFK